MTKKGLLKAAVALIAISGTASLSAFPITPFPRSLPNQAGVGYEFLWGSWDYITTPAYYTYQDKDTLSAFYTPDQSSGDFMVGGKTTVGLPIYWAARANNTGSTKEYEDASGTQEYTTANSRYAAQIGSVFAGFGVGAFFDQKTDYTEAKNTTATSAGTLAAGTYSATNSSKTIDAGNQYTQFGVNVGQNFEDGTVWGAGVSYSIVGGADETTTAAGTRKDEGGDQAYNRIDAQTFGWVPVGTEGDLVGWLVTFDQKTGSGDDALTDGTTANPVKTEHSDMNVAPGVFYTIALPLGDDSTFYLNPEVGYSMGSKSVKSTQSGATTEEKTTKQSAYVALPIMFAVNITKGLMLNVGWYPQVQVLGSTKVESIPATGTTTTTTTTEGIGKATTSSYGLGLTWEANDNLAFHLLGTNAANKVDAAQVSVGVDYYFDAATSASTVDTATTAVEEYEAATTEEEE